MKQSSNVTTAATAAGPATAAVPDVPVTVSPGCVLWLPAVVEDENARRNATQSAAQFGLDARVLDHPVLVLREIDGGRQGAVLVLPITSLGGRLLEHKFPGKKNVKARSKYLPLERHPPAPHPDSQVLLTVEISGNPGLRKRQSYVSLKPFLVNTQRLRPLYGGTVKLTPEAFRLVKSELAARYPKLSRLPEAPTRPGQRQAAPRAHSAPPGSGSTSSPPPIKTWPGAPDLAPRPGTGTSSPPPAYSTLRSPVLLPIQELDVESNSGCSSPSLSSQSSRSSRSAHSYTFHAAPPRRNLSPAAVARAQSLRPQNAQKQRIYPPFPSYPPAGVRTPLLYGYGNQVSVPGLPPDINIGRLYSSGGVEVGVNARRLSGQRAHAEEDDERDCCGSVFAVLQLAICAVVLLSFGVLAVWLFFEAVRYLHMG